MRIKDQITKIIKMKFLIFIVIVAIVYFKFIKPNNNSSDKADNIQ